MSKSQIFHPRNSDQQKHPADIAQCLRNELLVTNGESLRHAMMIIDVFHKTQVWKQRSDFKACGYLFSEMMQNDVTLR